ncbi:AraC family transcriptional regulator, arabinose operon regulatory protein [Lachnospiraceae bacterium C7]|nr:AraC family transcriptional regulator, arabinose operon regulatory protein [Lachnospiraceae bacterium C7]
MYNILKGGIFARHYGGLNLKRPHGINSYLLLIIKSESILYVNDTKHHVTPVNAIIIPPNTPYSYYNIDGDYTDDWLHFEASSTDLLDKLPISVPFQITNASILSSYINQLLWENYYTDEPFKTKHVDYIVEILLNHLYVEAKQEKKVTYTPYLQKLQQLRIYIKTFPAEAPSSQDAATQCGLSLSYFQHLYSETFGIPYKKDVINMRIAYAKELLTSTENSISDIIYLCGYQNQIHFFRQFKEITNVTPKNYREIHATKSN